MSKKYEIIAEKFSEVIEKWNGNISLNLKKKNDKISDMSLCDLQMDENSRRITTLFR